MKNNKNLEELIAPVLKEHGAFLVDIQVHGDHRVKMVELFVDTDEGINADRCAQISRDLGPILDTSEEFPGRYNIVVSSPGLDRPLKFLQQYRRNIGRTVTVTVHGEQGPHKVQGELVEVQSDYICIRAGNGEPEQIPISGIVQTLVVPRW